MTSDRASGGRYAFRTLRAAGRTLDSDAEEGVAKMRALHLTALLTLGMGFSCPAFAQPSVSPTESSFPDAPAADAEAPATSDADDAAEDVEGENQSAVEDCLPACRPGFVCQQGSCVSACNPPCGEGERCTVELTCELDAPLIESDAMLPPAVMEEKAEEALEESQEDERASVRMQTRFGVVAWKNKRENHQPVCVAPTFTRRSTPTDPRSKLR